MNYKLFFSYVENKLCFACGPAIDHSNCRLQISTDGVSVCLHVFYSTLLISAREAKQFGEKCSHTKTSIQYNGLLARSRRLEMGLRLFTLQSNSAVRKDSWMDELSRYGRQGDGERGRVRQGKVISPSCLAISSSSDKYLWKLPFLLHSLLCDFPAPIPCPERERKEMESYHW